MEYFAKAYDVAVIGAGHAGIEAGLAAARLGCSTAVFTINMDWVGNMPCNPSIGGTSKGHLVREIDALGGEMGKAADRYTLQSRMLNLGKGPAVHSLRAQIDRRAYAGGMKHTLERQDNLDLRQCEITDIVQGEDGLWRLTTKLEAIYTAKAVVLATGTFLGGRVYVGDVSYESGPDGMFPATALATALKKLGLPLRRFKTGTPSRVNARSLDFDKMEVQPGDDRTVPFSFETDTPPENKVVCHITYTNAATKQVILDNLDRSPMYSGKIEGKGPRYCPSFEDKVVRFSDRERHQLFVEPCGEKTEEMYLQGLSSSLPEDVQLAFIHTIPGLEHAQVMRTAYAIEYDCVDPRAMKASLEFHDFPGLFGAGQFNGSSGYEEAAAQGLVAGINAAMLVLGLLLAALEDLHLPHHAVFQHCHVVEQDEGLKHHAHMRAVFRRVDAPARHIGAVVEDLAAAGGFQQVDAPQQGGFTGAGSADDGNHVALLDSKVNIPQNLMGAEGLAEVADF